MKKSEDFCILFNKEIQEIYLIVWPPIGELNRIEIDISIGFVFAEIPKQFFSISVDKDELWRPYLYTDEIPINTFIWEDFYKRMDIWMNISEPLEIEKEYYDVTNSKMFEKVLGQKIQEIELLYISEIIEPFGVRICFLDEFILSLPNSDGNTIETTNFNQNFALDQFRKLGKIEYKKLRL